jgi:hypothetical protein
MGEGAAPYTTDLPLQNKRGRTLSALKGSRCHTTQILQQKKIEQAATRKQNQQKKGPLQGEDLHTLRSK